MQPFTNPSWYFNAGLDPSTYVTVPYAPADQRLRAFIKYAQQIPGAVAQIKKNVQMPLPKTFIDFSSKSFGGFVEFYRNDVPQAFAEVQDAGLKKQLAEVIEPAAKAMQDFAKWLAASEAGQSRLVRARAGALRRDGAHDGERHDAGRQARRDRPRRPAAQPHGARRGVQALRARRDDRRSASRK